MILVTVIILHSFPVNPDQYFTKDQAIGNSFCHPTNHCEINKNMQH